MLPSKEEKKSSPDFRRIWFRLSRAENCLTELSETFAANKFSSSLRSFYFPQILWAGNKFHLLNRTFEDRTNVVWLCQVWIFPVMSEIWAARPAAVAPLTFFSRRFSFMHRFTNLLSLKFYLELDSFTEFSLARSNQYTRLRSPNLWHHYFFFLF